MKLTKYTIDWVIERLVEWLIEWVIDWVIDKYMPALHLFHFHLCMFIFSSYLLKLFSISIWIFLYIIIINVVSFLYCKLNPNYRRINKSKDFLFFFWGCLTWQAGLIRGEEKRITSKGEEKKKEEMRERERELINLLDLVSYAV